MNEVGVSIVIRARNESEYIGRVLRKVFSQEYNGTYEVIVIDFGLTDKTIETVGQFPWVRIERLNPADFTFGYALNYGGRISRDNIVVYLSDDGIPKDSNWLRELMFPLKEESIVATYGRQEPIKGLTRGEDYS